jgi:hypothetical protein
MVALNGDKYLVQAPQRPMRMISAVKPFLASSQLEQLGLVLSCMMEGLLTFGQSVQDGFNVMLDKSLCELPNGAVIHLKETGDFLVGLGRLMAMPRGPYGDESLMAETLANWGPASAS